MTEQFISWSPGSKIVVSHKEYFSIARKYPRQWVNTTGIRIRISTLDAI